MNKAVEAVQRLYRRLVQPILIDNPGGALDNGRIIGDYVREAYRIGAQVGWKLTAQDVQRSAVLPQAILEMVIERANRAAEQTVTRLAERAATTPITGPQIAHQARVSGESSAWTGMDNGATEAARTYQLRLKTWVRAYARKEPRPGHTAMEGITIPFDDYFTMPSGARVWQPRDWANLPDPAEWVNCGHALRFSTQEVTQ